MNKKLVFVASLLLNALLVAFIFSQRPARSTPEIEPVRKFVRPNPRKSAAKLSMEITTQAPATNRFHWSQVESDDYFAYVAGLRTIGCPEKTIQDILIADIEKLYGERSKSYAPPKFWINAVEQENLRKTKRDHLRAWDDEKKQLIQTLLGVDWDSETHKDWVKEPEAEIILGYLTEAKAMTLMKIFKGSEKQRGEIQEGTYGILLDEDKDRLRQCSQGMEHNIKNLLAPSEFEEFLLRLSGMFQSHEMVGVDLTGLEFRKLVQLKTDPNFLAGIFGDEDRGPNSKAMEKYAKNAEPEIKQLLGDKRFADYQRSNDPHFQQVYQATKDLKVPVESVGKVYELRKLAFEEAKDLKADKTLSPEQRQVALQNIASQVQQAVVSVFGRENGEKYWKAEENWLKGISDAKVIQK